MNWKEKRPMHLMIALEKQDQIKWEAYKKLLLALVILFKELMELFKEIHLIQKCLNNLDGLFQKRQNMSFNQSKEVLFKKL